MFTNNIKVLLYVPMVFGCYCILYGIRSIIVAVIIYFSLVFLYLRSNTYIFAFVDFFCFFPRVLDIKDIHEALPINSM